MQNRSKPFKNGLFEDIQFEEIGEKEPEFAESSPLDGAVRRVEEWKIPEFRETISQESQKFRIYPIAMKIGQALGYVFVLAMSWIGQAIWFLVLVLAAFLVFVLSPFFGHGHERHVRGHRRRHGHGYGHDIDWRDVPTKGERTGLVHVQKDRTGGQTNINIEVNVNS